MRRLIKSRDYLKRCLGFLLIFGFISLGAIGGCNNNGVDPDSTAVVEEPESPEVVEPESPAVVDPDSIVGIAIAVDGDDNLVVVDSFLKAVVKVDPKTGKRTILLNPADDDMEMEMGLAFKDPRGIAVDGDIWVVDSGLKAVVKVDPETGKRTILLNPADDDMEMGMGLAFDDPRGIAVDGDDNLVVVDSGLKAVVRVNRVTGKRMILSDNYNHLGIDFLIPRGIAVDGDDNLVVVDSGLKAVILVDRVTGKRMTISDNEKPDMEPYFEDPRGIAVEGDIVDIAEDGYIWVLDSDAVIRVHRETGERTIISMIISRPPDGMDMGAGVGPAFEDPLGIAVGDDDNLVVVDSGLDRVIQVKRDGGNRSRIPISIYMSDDSTGMGP